MFNFATVLLTTGSPNLLNTTVNNVISMLKICYHFCPLLKLLSLSRELKQCAINLVLCSILLMLSFETARSDNKCRTILMAWNRR